MRAVALCALLAPALAWAHPFATRTAAHRLQIDVGLDTITLDYTVEAPFAGDEADPTSTARALDVQTLDEVTSGIVVLVDGVAVPLRPDPERRPRVRASPHSATLRVWIVADAPTADEATIVVSNGNYPDLAGQFWTEGTVDAQVDVLSTSLLPDGPDGRLLSGRWLAAEDARSTEIRARFRRGAADVAWHRLWRTTGTRRSLADASRPSLSGVRGFAVLGAIAGVGVGLLGTLVRARRSRARAAARVDGPS